jgi:RNA polymerase sigma-70 factor (ECF subfamily)
MTTGEGVLGRAGVHPAAVRAARFEAVFGLTYARLYGLAYRVLGDAMETEDTLQETYLRLASTPVLHRPDEEVSAWLRRVCLNLAANRLRNRARAKARVERAGRLAQADDHAETQDPARSALLREQRETVRRVLALLPRQQRDCLLLRHSGYTYAEIAATLGIAVGSVGVILARAEKAFRNAYGEQEHV